MAARSFRTEAVVLRSLRLGEADRIVHLASLEHGRLGAVALDEWTIHRVTGDALRALGTANRSRR